MKLRAKYTLILGIVTGVPLLVLTGVAGFRLYTQQVDEVHHELEQAALQRDSMLVYEVEAIRKEIETLVASPAISGIVESLEHEAYADDIDEPDGSWGEAWGVLYAFQQSMWGKYHHVFVTDLNGHVVLSPPKAPGSGSHVGHDIGLDILGDALRGESQFTSFFGFEESDHFHPLMTMPIKNSKGEVVGVMVAEVVVAHLLGVLEVEGSDVATRVFSDDGRPVVHLRTDAVQIEVPGVVGDAVGASGSFVLSDEEVDEAGGAVMGCYYASPDYPWVVGVERAKGEVFAPVRAGVMLMVGVGVGLALLSLAVSARLAAQLARPIGAISSRLTDIAAGDLTVRRLHGKGADEIGDLARSCNALIDSFTSIVGEIRGTAEGLIETSATLDGRSKEVAEEIKSTTGELMVVAAAAEELSASSGESANCASDACERVDEVERGVHASVSFVSATQESMRSLDERLGVAATSIRELAGLGDQVRGLVEAIGDVADQTNLLALNAAIEAARAGEHGRGFAVVADEVRKLADRTGVTTHEIAGSMTRIQEGIEQAAGVMTETCDACASTVSEGTEAMGTIEGLRAGAKEMGTLTATVRETAAEQNKTCTEVAGSLTKIDQMMRNTNDFATELLGEAGQMNERAQKLRETIGKFKV